MENLHVRLGTEEAINSKRNILHTEMSLLNLIKEIQDYRKLRNLELKNKTILKTELKKLITEMAELKKHLPKVREPQKKEKLEVEEGIGKITRGRLELELKEIREQLERLG